jgi:hypothetical protein
VFAVIHATANVHTTKAAHAITAIHGIDWNEVTAIATSVLALGIAIAGWGVWETRNAARRDLKATEDAARAAKLAAEQELQATREAATAADIAARHQIEASYRPLLVDVIRKGPVPPDMEAFRLDREDLIQIEIGAMDECIDPRIVWVAAADDAIYLSVPLRNVGYGVAVLNENSISIHEAAEINEVQIRRARVPPGETTRITCSFRPISSDEPARLTLSVPYSDFDYGQDRTAELEIRLTSDNLWKVDHIEQRTDDRATP